MKRLLIAFLVLFAAVGFGMADTRNVQDNYKFVYSIVDTAGNPVAGETVNLQIQRASDGYWLDFADTTFKDTGWTNKTTALTEDSTNGLYSYVFNPPASETGPEEYVFTVDNASATYGDHQSMTVTYQTVNTASVTVTTNSDKSGYALTQTFPTNFSALAITPTTGYVTVGTNTDKAGYTASTVSDKTGYSLTQTFPTNFSDLAITASTGRVTVGTNSDKADYALSTASVNAVADAVFDEAMSGHTAAGTFGESMQNLTYYTNGQKDGGVYNGIENMIRTNR